MQENFISHYPLKPCLALEDNQPTSLQPQEIDSSVLMTSFDTFHSAPEELAKRSDAEQDYQAGFAAGKAEAGGVYESTIKVMEATLESLKSGFKTHVETIEESHQRVVLKCLEVVLPQLSEQVLLLELQNILCEANGQNLANGTHIKLHPDNHIAKEFLSQQSGQALTIIEDKAQGETGVSVSWDNSRTDIDPTGAAKRCLSLLGSIETNVSAVAVGDERELGLKNGE